jgi:hypothetical protein
MTDTPTPSPETPSASSTPPEPRPKRPWTILGRLAEAVREQNWFAVVLELCIVIVGVVIGFQITAWGQSRQDRAKEQTYLRQLVADLSETERIMANRDSAMAARTQHSVDQLMISFGTTPRPPRDSVARWLTRMGYTATPRPVLGTAEALVASGDFGAVRSDSLRAAILRYLDVTRERMADQALTFTMAQASMRELQGLGLSGPGATETMYDIRVADILRPRGAPFDSSEHAASPDWKYPFPYDVMDIYENQEFLDVLSVFRQHVGGMQVARTVMLESAVELREQVTRTMGE